MHESKESEDLLFRLTEELAAASGAGETIDLEEIAARFETSPEVVADCLEGVQRLQGETPESTSRDLARALPADYEVEDELGRGGMGVVFRARQRSLDRVVAVKLLEPSRALFDECVRRFKKEARSLALLRHPNIVSIHEIGENEGRVYFTMDYIEGESLATLVREKRMTHSRAVHIVRQVTAAIAYAHSRGIIHRDIKPGNILVNSDGDAFVVDFGLARDVGLEGQMTRTGELLGTPVYMSPEQAEGHSGDIHEATDIYSIGAVLYECLTGKPPFTGTLAQIIRAVVEDEPPAPRSVEPSVPFDLEVICRKTMEKNPERRYASAGALLADLERYERGWPVLARPATTTYRLSRFLGRHRRAVAAALVSALLGTLVALWAYRVYLGPRDVIQEAQRLRDQGEDRAAALLLERLFEEKGSESFFERSRSGWRLTDIELAEKFVLVMQVKLETVRQRMRDGRTEEALEMLTKAKSRLESAVAQGSLLRRVPSNPEEKRGLELYLELQGLLGDACILEDEGGAIWVFDERDRLIESLSGHGLEAIWSPNRLRRALSNVDEPGHRNALFVLKTALERDRADAWLQWLLRQTQTASVEMLIEATDAFGTIRFDSGEPLPGLARGRHYDHFASALAGPTTAEGLAARAADESLGEEARSLAADLLCVAADLPLRVGWNEDVGLRPDPAARADAVAIWQRVAGLSREARYRELVGIAAEMLEGTTRDRFLFVRRWLYQHTAAPVRGADSSAVWKRWWSENHKLFPEDWLARALGLAEAPGPDDVDRVYGILQEAQTDEQRAWAHHLLVLMVPEDLEVPALPPGRQPTPHDFDLFWERALGRTSRLPAAPASERTDLLAVSTAERRVPASISRKQPPMRLEHVVLGGVLALVLSVLAARAFTGGPFHPAWSRNLVLASSATAYGALSFDVLVWFSFPFCMVLAALGSLRLALRASGPGRFLSALTFAFATAVSLSGHLWLKLKVETPRDAQQILLFTGIMGLVPLSLALESLRTGGRRSFPFVYCATFAALLFGRFIYPLERFWNEVLMICIGACTFWAALRLFVATFIPPAGEESTTR